MPLPIFSVANWSSYAMEGPPSADTENVLSFCAVGDQVSWIAPLLLAVSHTTASAGFASPES